MLKVLFVIPLHIFVALIYAPLAYSRGAMWFDQSITIWTLPSGGLINITPGFCLMCLMLALLLFEMMKAVQTGWTSVTNNILSTILFLTAFGLLLTVGAFGTTTWLLFTAVMAIDTLAGWSVGQVAAKRDFGGLGA